MTSAKGRDRAAQRQVHLDRAGFKQLGAEPPGRGSAWSATAMAADVSDPRRTVTLAGSGSAGDQPPFGDDMTSALTGEILPAGGQPSPVSPTRPSGDGVLEQLRREWLVGYGSANTRTAYDGDLTNWLAFLGRSGVDPLTEGRTVHTHAWLRTLEAAGEAPATRGRRLAAVSAFYKWLISEGHTERANPAAIDAKRKPQPPRSPKTASLTRDQARALLATADEDTGPQAARTAAIVAVLLLCGLRVSELVGADVDELAQDRGHRVLRFTVKGDGQHVVALPAPVLDRLDAYLASREDLAGDRLPVVPGGAGARRRRPLFVTESGGRLDRGAVWRLLRRLAKAAGIAVMMSPHVLRHTYATLARDAGVPLDDVQDGLGHADPRTTRRYDHGGVRLDRSPGYALARELADVQPQK